jgi:hypothetical protein
MGRLGAARGRAAHEHSHEVPELRAMWMEIIDRFALATILLWSSAQCAYVAGLGIDARIADMEALFDPMLTIWMRALYGEA